MHRPVDWSPESSADALDLGRIVGAFRRHVVVFVVTVVSVTGAVALLTSQLSRSYSASAMLLIEQQAVPVFDMRSVADGATAAPASHEVSLATQVNLLTSRSHARRAVEELALTNVAEFQPQPKLLERTRAFGHGVVQRVAWSLGAKPVNGNEGDGADGSGPLAGAVDAQPSAAAPEGRQDGSEAINHAVDHLLDQLSVNRDGLSEALVVRFSAGDAELAAAVTNTVVDIYLRQQVERKVAAIDAAERWVRERLAVLRDELLEAERRIERYRVANNLQESRDGILETQQLASLNTQLIAAQADRRVAEARLARFREIQANGGTQELINEIGASPMIDNLRQQDTALQLSAAQLSREFGPQHPRMLEIAAERDELRLELDNEIARIIGSIADEVARAAALETGIEAALAEARGSSAVVQEASVELRELEREAAARRAVYEAMLGRLQEIQEQRDLLRPDARVISTAPVPDEPSFPKPSIMLAAGFLGSLGLGVLLVTVAELRDRTLRNSRQIERTLGLPTLALVPTIDHLRPGETPAGYLVERPHAAYAEAIREVEATRRMLAEPAEGGRVVLVTSSLPGEGKTSLATSLALTAARNGRRTILVDLDLRCPSVKPMLSVPQISGGTTRMLDLLVLGDEAGVANRILIRPAMLRQLIEQLRNTYDQVIIDSAPLLGLADTKTLTGLADQVLFVVRWGSTPEAAARAALQSLHSSASTVVGVVLTRVDMKKHAKYGYGDAISYYHRYRKYYVD